MLAYVKTIVEKDVFLFYHAITVYYDKVQVSKYSLLTSFCSVLLDNASVCTMSVDVK